MLKLFVWRDDQGNCSESILPEVEPDPEKTPEALRGVTGLRKYLLSSVQRGCNSDYCSSPMIILERFKIRLLKHTDL